MKDGRSSGTSLQRFWYLIQLSRSCKTLFFCQTRWQRHLGSRSPESRGRRRCKWQAASDCLPSMFWAPWKANSSNSWPLCSLDPRLPCTYRSVRSTNHRTSRRCPQITCSLLWQPLRGLALPAQLCRCPSLSTPSRTSLLRTELLLSLLVWRSPLFAANGELTAQPWVILFELNAVFFNYV